MPDCQGTHSAGKRWAISTSGIHVMGYLHRNQIPGVGWRSARVSDSGWLNSGLQTKTRREVKGVVRYFVRINLPLPVIRKRYSAPACSIINTCAPFNKSAQRTRGAGNVLETGNNVFARFGSRQLLSVIMVLHFFAVMRVQ